jgi:RND family efflux transporter MFP subunit
MNVAKTVYVSFLLAGVVAGVGCGKPEENSSVVPMAVAKASDHPSSLAPQDSAYIASGPLVVEDQVDVAAQRAGVIGSILADVGQTVHKGELLAMLDDRQLTAEREAADARWRSGEASLKDWEAETEVAQSDFKRAQAMFDAGISTQEALDHAHYKLVGSQYEIEKAKQDLRNAAANLRDLDLELQKTHIEAPFDGVVARRYVRAGQTMAPGDRLFWITALQPLRLKFTLPGKFINQVKPGERIEVSSSDNPSIQHQAKIVRISPVVDPASQSFEVVAEIVERAPDLRPGMTANARLEPAR